MRETYAPVLLKRKAARLRKETGNPNLVSKSDEGLTPTELLKRSIVRPMKLLLLSPIVFLLSTFCALVFGLTFLLFTTFPLVFESQYGFSSGISGLSYLRLGIGMILGLALFSVLSDKMVKQLKKKAGDGEMKPEYRLPLMVYFAPIMPIGFFWYGWSPEAQVHWIVPIIGTLFIGLGSLFVIVSAITPICNFHTFQNVACI
jgi:MFS family permease